MMFMPSQSQSGGVIVNPYIGNLAEELQFLTRKETKPILRLDCHRQTSNNGLCILSPAEEFDEIYTKAQCLVHYSYQISKRKLMMLDTWGSSFKLYDPQIATRNLLASDASLGPTEVNFCAGNLSGIAIDE